jgi:DNA repair photolyase
VVILERRSRKGPVLTPSSLPCLSNTPTINITEGCAHGCAYCYTQGYSNYPGPDRVVLFANTPELVRAELARKRRRPQRAYFSPSSDAFQPIAEVQEITYQTMATLLEGGIEIAFLTKGVPEERFFALFAKSPSLVFAQVGITTLCAQLWSALEAGAAAPMRRLEVIDRLTRMGVATMGRLDPLIPDLTDTDSNLESLLSELARRSVQSFAASYLFLRPAFAHRMVEAMRLIHGSAETTREWTWQPLADGVGGGHMIGTQERCQRFSRLRAAAARHGVEVHVCTCKNPGLGDGPGCQIAGPTSPRLPDNSLPLFNPDARC